MAITVYAICYRKNTSTDPSGDGRSDIGLLADLDDVRNDDWGTVTDDPYLMLSMAVNADIADQFELEQAYTLTIAEVP